MVKLLSFSRRVVVEELYGPVEFMTANESGSKKNDGGQMKS